MSAWIVSLFTFTVVLGLVALVLGVVFTTLAKRERRQLAIGIPRIPPEAGPLVLRGMLAKRIWWLAWSRVGATIRVTEEGLDILPVLLARQWFRWGDIAFARWQGHFSPLRWVWTLGGPMWVLHLELWDRRDLEIGVWGRDASLLDAALRASGVDAGFGAFLPAPGRPAAGEPLGVAGPRRAGTPG